MSSCEKIEGAMTLQISTCCTRQSSIIGTLYFSLQLSWDIFYTLYDFVFVKYLHGHNINCNCKERADNPFRRVVTFEI